MSQLDGPVPGPSLDASSRIPGLPVPSLSSEELVQLIGNTTRTMVWGWDILQNRVVAHQLLEEVFGKVPEDLRGALNWWKERAHPDDQARLLGAFDAGLLGDTTTLRFEYSIRDQTGAYRVVEDCITINRDAQGFPIRVFGAARDITVRRHAQETQARLARILEATPDIVAITTIDGRLLHLNRAGRHLMGVAPEQGLTDQNLARLHPAWALEIVRHEGIAVALSDGVWEGETAVLAPDGRELPVSQIILAHPRPDGSVE